MKKIVVVTLVVLLFSFCDSNNQEIALNEANSIEDVKEDSSMVSLSANYYMNEKLSDIENAIILKPTSPNVYYKRAIYYKLRKKYALALEDINRSLKLSPDAAIFNYEKADILYEYGVFIMDVSKIDEAEIYLDHTLTLDKELEEALLLKAEILLYNKDAEGSMRLVNDVLKVNNTQAYAYFTKGRIYHFMGSKNLAVSSYQTAIEMDPNFYDAYINLGVLLGEKMDSKAVDYYNFAIDIFPSSIEAHRNKGLFYFFSGDYTLAKSSFNEIIAIDSTFEEAYFNIGNTYIGMYSDTMKPYSKDTTLNQAIFYFQKAIELNPVYVQAIHNLGLQYEYKGDKEKAKEYYLKAIDIDNNYAPSLNAINQL